MTSSRRPTRLLSVLSMLAAVLLACLSGCTANDDAYSPPTAPPTDEPSVNLGQAKAAAKIADCPRSGAQPARPDGLPDLTLTCLGGGRSVRLAGLRGKPMVINIWAQWCPPCRAEAPHLAELAKINNGKLMIIGVDFADPQPGYAIEFAQLAGWRYPQLQDPDSTIKTSIPFSGPPQTLLVSADGKIAYRHNGPFTSIDQLKQLVHDHLQVSL